MTRQSTTPDDRRTLAVPLSARDRAALDAAADTERLTTAAWVRMVALREARKAVSRASERSTP